MDPEPSLPPTAAVVGVGDELLLGQTTDTNGSWISRFLSDLGFRVVGRWVVGDTAEAIRDAVGAALAAARLVVVTGGLGPTPDDVTREAVAELLGQPLALDPALLDVLARRFRERGLGEVPESARAMAVRPEGAVVLRNRRGAAPGLWMETSSGGVCVLLPGVPHEMKGLMEEEVAIRLEERFGGQLLPVTHREIHTAGIAESVLADRIRELGAPELRRVSLAYLPYLGGVRLRLSVRQPSSEVEARKRLDEAERALDPVVAPFRFRARSGDLAEAVGNALERAGLRLAVAESCTGGLVAKRLTDHPGASRYFEGGVVAYSNAAKTALLGVDPGLIARWGAVSRETAEAMAAGVRTRFGVGSGLAVTGIAGPTGGTEEKPVGTVWMAVSLRERVVAERARFPGGRREVRERAGQAALALLLRVLRGESDGGR